MELILACMSVIWSGSAGAIPKSGSLSRIGRPVDSPGLDRMDRHFDDQGFNSMIRA
jgi:hypothetical protein